MTRLSESIADFNEQHGVAGVIINGRAISNDELREARVFGLDRWAQACIGRTFKRPKGKQTYTLRETVWEQFGWRTVPSGICDTPQGERKVALTELVKMEVVG